MSQTAHHRQSLMTQMTSLHEDRLDRVTQILKSTGARRVLDLGCGSGSLLYRLMADTQFDEITGLEYSGESLRQARQMVNDQGTQNGARVRLCHGSYTESHPELHGFDAAAMVETIEHVSPEKLSCVERCVFQEFRPAHLLMTTPNREYNPLFDLAPGTFREPDHKFEWDRQRFQKWARGVASRTGYTVRFDGIGDYVPGIGHPTQTALFTRTT